MDTDKLLRTLNTLDGSEGLKRIKIVVAGIGTARVAYEIVDQYNQSTEGLERREKLVLRSLEEKNQTWDSLTTKEKQLYTTFLEKKGLHTYDWGDVGEVFVSWLLVPLLIIFGTQWIVSGFLKRQAP